MVSVNDGLDLGERAIAWPPDRARPGPALKSGSCFTWSRMQAMTPLSKKKKGLPGCIGGRLHTRIQLRKRRRQTGPRSRPSPFPRLQMSSPEKEHTGNCFDFDFAPGNALVSASGEQLEQISRSGSGCYCSPTGGMYLFNLVLS